MKRLPRLCWVVPAMRVGGTERQLLHLMRGLVHEFELTLVCTTTDGALIGDARRVGAYVRVLDLHGGWDCRQRARLRRIFEAHTPHLVHTALSGFDYFANRAARDAGVAAVVSSRRELATWQQARHLAIQRRANACVDAVVANSRAAAAYAVEREGLDAARVRVIHNGVEAADFAGGPPDPTVRTRFKLPPRAPIVAMFANFSPVKDHALFVGMAAALARRRSDAHFLLVGAGAGVEAALARAERAGIGGRVTRLATVSELRDLYAVCAVCVLTSRVEGFPNVLLEAQAAGKPVVAAAVGGIPEAVEDGRTGVLIPTRNPEDFANAVAALLDDPARAAAIGAAGAAHVRAQFTVERMVAQHRALYVELLCRTMHVPD